MNQNESSTDKSKYLKKILLFTKKKSKRNLLVFQVIFSNLFNSISLEKEIELLFVNSKIYLNVIKT